MSASKIRYFELEFEDGYSIIIKAVREPNIEEAEEFIKEDMEKLGYNHIENIVEWNREDALTSFDFENEDKWSVFGK